MIEDYIKLAFGTFRAKKKRTFLTMLGIFIGIAAVVSLISLGQGLEKAITEQFEKLGTNKIMIMPAGSTMGMPTGSTSALTNEDLDVVKKTKGIGTAGGMFFKLAKVQFKDETKYTFAIGLPQDESKRIIFDISNFKIAKGRDLKKSDQRKVLAGSRFANPTDFFESALKIGDSIEIQDQKFEVIGFLEPIGNPSDDSQLYLNMDIARELFAVPENIDFIMAEVTEGTKPADAAESIKKALRKHRNVKEDEEDFDVQTFEEYIKTFETIFTIVQAVLIGIAAISLLVGGIGIMNTMFTSVLERTREIGVMKAIGARNSDIMRLFLLESGFLGMAGGIVGIIIGAGMSKAVEFVAAQQGLSILKAYFPWYLILGALAFSFLIGTIAGVTPAIRASRLKPVDALRYE